MNSSSHIDNTNKNISYRLVVPRSNFEVAKGLGKCFHYSFLSKLMACRVHTFIIEANELGIEMDGTQYFYSYFNIYVKNISFQYQDQCHWNQLITISYFDNTLNDLLNAPVHAKALNLLFTKMENKPPCSSKRLFNSLFSES